MENSRNFIDPKYLQLIAGLVSGYKKRTYSLMHLNIGDKVIDFGCGPGTDTLPLANIVGPQGLVVGIDSDEKMIEMANELAEKSKLKDIIKHEKTNAANIPFQSNFFNSARSERLFQHVYSPKEVLSEMIRVTKSGGWIVVLETDWNSLSIDTDNFDLEQKLKEYRLKHFHQNGFAGRQLFRLFTSLNLQEIVIEMCPIYLTDYSIGNKSALLEQVEKNAIQDGFITKDEIELWHDSILINNIFFGSINQMLIAARKP